MAYVGLLAAFLCGPGRTVAAEWTGELRDFVVRTWGKAEGLPDTSVTAILQTRDAYLWVGTSAGLVRFDGVRFTETPLRVTGSNPPIAITALCEDTRGRLWIGSQQQGLFCLADGAVKRYGKAEGLLDENVTSLAIDAHDDLWIGTRHGVTRWNGRGFAAFTSREGLPDDFVSGVHAARSGSILITTRGGMCRLLNDRIAPFEFEAAGQGRNPEFLGAYEDLRGNLWAFGATYLINLAERKRFNYFHGNEPASRRIWSLCEGRDGRLWIGTSGRGLFCFDGQRFQPVMLSEVHQPNDVRAICEDSEGNLWLGISGGGLVQLRPQSYARVKASQGLPAGAATCLALDAIGRVYVVLESGGIFVNLGQRFERFSDRTGWVGQDLESTLCAGLDGSLWVGTAGTGMYRIRGGRAALFTTANGLSDNCVLAICATTDGAIWAGTRAGTLHRFKEETLAGSHRRLRLRLARLEQQRAMERERMRIAQDMHDEIGSKLTKISFLSERAKVELKETGPVAGQIDSIAHTSRELLQALDEIVWAVNPHNDTLEHLAAYLAQYAAEYFQNTTVDCDLRLQAELPPQVMSAEIRHNLFLAFEECLNNVLKHAGASKVRVEIKADPGQMQITISDNGRGFELNVKTRENSTDSGSNRNGLRNIHQRLAEVGGQCHIQSRPGEGTTVRLHIPLSSAKFQPA